MLYSDLAELYGVPTKVLKQVVKRNIERFPEDFMFVLSRQEVTNLKSQMVTSSSPPRNGQRRKIWRRYTRKRKVAGGRKKVLERNRTLRFWKCHGYAFSLSEEQA